MAAEDVARSLRAWAIKEGLLAKTLPEAEAAAGDDDLGDYIEEGEQAEAAPILRRRGITAIAYDNQNNKVYVFTNRKGSKADAEALPDASGDVEIIYRKGAAAAVKSASAGLTPASPCHRHNNRYACGSSIFVGNRVGAGTLGCLVRDANGIYGLTNNHVSGGCNHSDPDLPILAPGALDVAAGGFDPFTIGYHTKLLPLAGGSPENVDISRNYDAAIFRLSDPALVTSYQRGAYDTPANCAPIQPNIQVQKAGRSTGVTTGIVRGKMVDPDLIEYTVPEFNTRAIFYFQDAWIVEGVGGPFSDIGDSGSLVTQPGAGGARVAVGLVFACSKDKRLTFVTPLDRVLDMFQVTLVAGHNV